MLQHSSAKGVSYFNTGGITIQHKTALFCEFDKYAAESYCAVHGMPASLNIGDITQADEKTVPDFNTMFGGSPCQDFSIAGKQHGHVKPATISITP